MKKFLWLLAAVACCSAVAGGQPGRFLGKVAVEWLDDDPFIARMRLLEDFVFQDALGRTWMADKGSVIDGRSLPLVFRDWFGLPFEGPYRKTALIYDHYCQTMSEPWRGVQQRPGVRMTRVGAQRHGALCRRTALGDEGLVVLSRLSRFGSRAHLEA